MPTPSRLGNSPQGLLGPKRAVGGWGEAAPRTRAALFSAETESTTKETARARNRTDPGQCWEERPPRRAQRPEGGGLQASVPGAGPRQREVRGARPALPASRALHLHGALRPQVGPQHVLQPPGRADVDRQRRLGSGHLSLGIQGLHGRHS